VNGRRSRIVLAGGGHAHLYTLRRTAELVRRGYEVVLVNPQPHLYYSGMATGVVSGVYAPEEYRIDVRRLAESGGGRFVEGRVRRIDPGSREVVLEAGDSIPYGVLGVGLGSGVPGLGTEDGALPVKPVENLLRLRARILEGGKPRVLVVGGGPAGCEVAANLRRLMETGAGGAVTLAEAADTLLPGSPGRAQREVLRFLRSRGVKVMLGSPLAGVRNGSAVLGGGERLEFDVLVPAVGVRPNDVFGPSGLLTAGDGSLWVNRHLQSVSDPRIFGGGDSVAYRGEPLPRLGVFAVRQGPVLFHNLRAALAGERLREYRPQRRYLYILNLGDGTGLVIYGGFAVRSRWAWRLKDRIDRRFVEEFGAS
jgi:NADH dehydrogenase FAD-containing subunit